MTMHDMMNKPRPSVPSILKSLHEKSLVSSVCANDKNKDEDWSLCAETVKAVTMRDSKRDQVVRSISDDLIGYRNETSDRTFVRIVDALKGTLPSKTTTKTTTMTTETLPSSFLFGCTDEHSLNYNKEAMMDDTLCSGGRRLETMQSMQMKESGILSRIEQENTAIFRQVHYLSQQICKTNSKETFVKALALSNYLPEKSLACGCHYDDNDNEPCDEFFKKHVLLTRRKSTFRQRRLHEDKKNTKNKLKKVLMTTLKKFAVFTKQTQNLKFVVQNTAPSSSKNLH
jgi:hypothetical protein